MRKRVKVCGVNYRQGFIEVMSGVHAGHVNLELWKVSSEVDLSPLSVELGELEEGSVQANVELELTKVQAKLLIAMLQRAVEAT